jgi:hypothetical protein
MRSRQKIKVEVTNIYDKKWAKITILDGKPELVPSFEDHFRIILAIVHCERKKYANMRSNRPSALVARFLAESVEIADRLLDQGTWTLNDIEREWLALSLRMKLPARTRTST